MSSKGYIRLYRKIRDHRYYPEKDGRAFSKLEAWIDLILSASGLPRTITYRDQVINLKRGQLIIAERSLSVRWKWSREKVRRLLQNLAEEEEIRYLRRDHRLTIISIVNYRTYNPLSLGSQQPSKVNETTGKTTGETTDETNIKKEESKYKESIKNKDTTQQIFFCFDKKKFLNINNGDKEGWGEAYPACEIDLELKKMREWLLANPGKKKKNYRRFIINWLSRSQERGGSIASTPISRSRSRVTPGMKGWVEKKEG